MNLDYIYRENDSLVYGSAISDLYFDGMVLICHKLLKNCIISLNKNDLKDDVYVDKLNNYKDIDIARLDRNIPGSVMIGDAGDVCVSLYNPSNETRKYTDILIASICKYLREHNLNVFTAGRTRISIEDNGVTKSLASVPLSQKNENQASRLFVVRFNSRNDLMNDLLIKNNSPCLCMEKSTYDTNTSGLQNYNIDFTQEEFSLGVAQKLSERLGYTLNQREFTNEEKERINTLSMSRDNDNWRYYGK